MGEFVTFKIQMKQQEKKNRYGYIEGTISIIGNLILFGLKYWVGIMSGSLALTADAAHRCLGIF